MSVSSGVTGSFNLRVSDVIEHAGRRCGVPPADLGFENQAILTDNLWMILSYMSTRGVNLWRQYNPLFGLYPGQANYVMNAGDIQVEDALIRTPTQLAGTVTSSAGGTVASLTDLDTETVATQSSPNGNFQWDFGSGTPQIVALVGLLPNGSTTYNLVFEYSTDGSTWNIVYSQGSTAYTDGLWQWLQFDPAYSARYFRVRETGGATMSFREIFVCAVWQDIAMGVLNRDDYMNLPNKRFPGTPRQYWFDRQLTPVMRMWPVPDTAFQLMTCLTHRHIEDVGALSNLVNIPQRFYADVILELSLMSLPELQGADLSRLPLLQGERDAKRLDTENDDHDASPLNITPNIAAYNR